MPPSFNHQKHHITTSLSTPSESYTDASPKGTLDTAIVPLIHALNALEGVVTTSSCAGRVSVFVEGGKGAGEGRGGGNEGGGKEDGYELREPEGGRAKGKKAVPGGKGLGGRWSFVSHDPVAVPERTVDGPNKEEEGEEEAFTRMFGLTRAPAVKGEPKAGRRSRQTKNARFVRFAFEPMILHIATASLAHAAPILSAAISAGFRESGVQSLKNLTDPNAVPMVAVRSAGLAFESIIGVVRAPSKPSRDPQSGQQQSKQQQDQEEEEVIEALVEEEYFETLVGIANQRFEANTARIRRFEERLFGGRSKKDAASWEDKQTRQQRKRREGLQRKEELKTCGDGRGSKNGDAEDQDIIVGNLEDTT